MHRFLLSSEALTSAHVLLDKKESHHARRVLRVKPGEVVEVLDGAGGRYRAVVAGFKNELVGLSIERRLENEGTGPSLTLAPSVIRPERMEWMLEKACELGAEEWAPVLTERSIIQLSRERWQAKAVRWRKIAQESCKQCGLSRLPQTAPPVPYKDMVRRIGLFDLTLIATLTVSGTSLQEAFQKKPDAQSLLFLIGPEGDFTPQETQEAVREGAVPVSLGSLVLRAETAGLFALSAASFFYASSKTIRNKKK